MAHEVTLITGDGTGPELAEAARLNGVNDLQWLTQEEANALEPELSCVAALLSPSSPPRQPSSPLVSAGVGGDLPKYVGAKPPQP